MLGLYVHVALRLKWEDSRNLTFKTSEARTADASISVLIINKQGSANSTVLALVVITAWKCSRAGLSPIETPVLAFLGAKASETSIMALTNATILAWLLFTSTDIFFGESAWDENNSLLLLKHNIHTKIKLDKSRI